LNLDEAEAKRNTMTNILITGGTGFIGRHLVKHLLSHGFDGQKVHILLLTRNLDNLPEDLRSELVTPLAGELDDLPRMGHLLQKVEYVFHLAAEADMRKGSDFRRHNYEGTLSLLKALAGVPVKRFVYASTIGAVDRMPGDACVRPLNEDDPPFPLSEYGRSKLLGEKAVAESGFKYSIIRITWAYGPGMRPDSHIRKLMQGVHDGKLFSLFNFPGRVSIVAVSDLVRAFVLIAEKNEAKNRIFFASDGYPISLGDLFRIMGEMTGKKTARINIPAIAAKALRGIRKYLPLTVQNLHSDVLCASSARLSELGFIPLIGAREGMRLLAQSLGLCPYHFAEEKKLISVITGAGGGIGRALADLMILKGHKLLLVDKDEKKLLELSRLYDVDSLCLDLASPLSWVTLRDHIISKKYTLDWILNNAGIGARGPMAGIPFERQKMMLDLNCSAATFITQLAITEFISIGRGVLVNIASSAAFQPMPGMSVYAATKAYILALSRSLSGEVSDIPGIHILIASPSGTETGFQDTAGVKRTPGEKLLSPGFVAERILDAVYRGKREIVIGLVGKAMYAAAYFLPIGAQIKIWAALMRSKR